MMLYVQIGVNREMAIKIMSIIINESAKSERVHVDVSYLVHLTNLSLDLVQVLEKIY